MVGLQLNIFSLLVIYFLVFYNVAQVILIIKKSKFKVNIYKGFISQVLSWKK